MMPQARPDGRQTTRSRWLTPFAVAFALGLFGIRYIRFPLAMLARAVDAVSVPRWLSGFLRWPYIGLYAALYPIDLIYTRLWIYLALTALGLAVVFAALLFGRPSRLGRVALLISLLAIAGVPFVYRYRPVVRVDPARVDMKVPTQPGPIAGVVKAAQSAAEIRRCSYTLLGWGDNDALYGEEVCDSQHRLWAYYPMSSESLETVASVPDELFRREVTRDDLRAAGVTSTIPQDDLRIAVRVPALVSNEGWWFAFVARHLYGPEDVVVVVR